MTQIWKCQHDPLHNYLTCATCAEEVKVQGQRWRDEAERLQNKVAELEASIRRNQEWLAQKSNEKVAAIDMSYELMDALKSMIGIFDNPIARRRIGGEMADEARTIARETMEKYK